MAVNRDKPDRWKSDIAQSVDMYNDWFMNFAPAAFRSTRIQTTRDVEQALKITGNLTNIQPEILREHPAILPTLRMATCPPIAVDRLIGLAGVPSSLVKRMENANRQPSRMDPDPLDAALRKIGSVIEKMADRDILVWLERNTPPTEAEIHRAAIVVADRLCGSVANPIIRNAQEKRQLAGMASWLEAHGYRRGAGTDEGQFTQMTPGTFNFHVNIPIKLDDGIKQINIAVDAVIMPTSARSGQLPLLVEAKSAGDFANVNKRRKEEATKMYQLRSTYGPQIQFNLFLCGYFDTGYLGYEAAEGIDWVWEHRIDDLVLFGL